MFLNPDRPLAVLLQLGGVALIAYDLLTAGGATSTGVALLGLALFLTGALRAKRRL